MLRGKKEKFLKNIISGVAGERENHLQSVRDKSKGQTKCQTGLWSVSKTLPLRWTDLLTAEILPDLYKTTEGSGGSKTNNAMMNTSGELYVSNA